ncbi:hypothetical protein ACP4OV_002296 [Aristida adscensionis]
MALCTDVSQVATIAQLAGIDASGLISMIVDAAKTVKRNQETCQLLARRAGMIGDLLQQLHSTQLMRHTETRNPVEQLEESLRHAYMLIKSCQGRSYLHSCFIGRKHSDQLREVQNEITFYLQLFPLVSFIDTARTWEHVLSRDRPSCSEFAEQKVRSCSYSTISEGLKAQMESCKANIMNVEVLENRGRKGAGISYFSFSEIMTATDNLSDRNLVGIGGFGYVYKGKLCNGADIAVKRHSTSSYQRSNEFRAEIEAIPGLRHKNIITLLGCCIQEGEKILVYEYMPNKSLASAIADETRRKLQNWSKRLQIIKGIADGLAYLHGHSQMCIVHRDINPNNILLDHEMNAKISDFGLAIKLAPNTTADVVICGTYGYADPEYVATGKISEKADVYSFGIILLELISGKLFWSYKIKAKGTSLGLLLPDYARKYQNKLHKLIDPLLHATKHDRAQIKQCVKVGLRCIRNCAKERPTMSEVVAMLCAIKVVRE